MVRTRSHPIGTTRGRSRHDLWTKLRQFGTLKNVLIASLSLRIRRVGVQKIRIPRQGPGGPGSWRRADSLTIMRIAACRRYSLHQPRVSFPGSWRRADFSGYNEDRVRRDQLEIPSVAPWPAGGPGLFPRRPCAHSLGTWLLATDTVLRSCWCCSHGPCKSNARRPELFPQQSWPGDHRKPTRLPRSRPGIGLAATEKKRSGPTLREAKGRKRWLKLTNI